MKKKMINDNNFTTLDFHDRIFENIHPVCVKYQKWVMYVAEYLKIKNIFINIL